MLLFLQTFFGLKTAFQNCKWFQKLKHFRIFFSVSLHAALWRLIQPFHCFLRRSSSFNFQLSPQTRRSSSGRPVYQTSLSDPPQIRPPRGTIRSDRHTRPSDQTATPDHQIRSPHQTTDHHPWLLSLQSSQHTQPLEMVQVRCIPYGLGERGYIELWMNLAKHTFHTLSAWIFRTFFSA